VTGPATLPRGRPLRCGAVGLLEGHRAIVTGGGSGIGRATCRRMAGEGARVAVIDIDRASAELVAEEIDGVAYAADVTDFDALESAVRDAADRLGGLTALFNNAGASFISHVHEWPPEEWHRIVTLNLTGVFHGMKAAVPLMLDGGGGSIVSTASISATRPSAGEAPYSAAKAGVVAMTANAALEYAPSIRVNAVSPGMIRTGMTEPLLGGFEGIEDELAARTPLARVGVPDDIAHVVVFLCSDLARYVTGQNLVVDGGMTLHGAATDGILERLKGLMAGNQR
jgi:NAD(P)-dependent dehydrogenase (short-subunit alcohol dehydrogenase family)